MTKIAPKNDPTQKKGQFSCKRLWILAIFMFVLGGFCATKLSTFVVDTLQETAFPLTNPALNYSELRETLMSNRVLNLSKKIDNYTAQKKKAGDISHLSVYFRNLNNGGWFGLEEKEYFSPASLMKLPILMAYIKKSEGIPGFLEQKITYQKTAAAGSYKQNIAPERQLIPGKEYTLREMLEDLIIYSDNNASDALVSMLSEEDLLGVFREVGAPFPAVVSGTFDNNMRVIDYAGFFRNLFNASYLNRKDSQKVLDLLTKIKFVDGIVKGVPKNIAVAHKFGERGIIGMNGTEETQLHDCGIVYYPHHPYILCVMTRGNSWTKLSGILADVSSIVYSEVENRYGNNPDSDEE